MMEDWFNCHLKVGWLDKAYPQPANKWPVLNELHSNQNLQGKIRNLLKFNRINPRNVKGLCLSSKKAIIFFSSVKFDLQSVDYCFNSFFLKTELTIYPLMEVHSV